MRVEEKALFEKLESGDFPEAVEELVVQSKIDVNDCFKEGYTPLMVAAQKGCANTARKLIELGADVNAATSDDGDTALIEASYNNQLEVLLLLIEKGVNINHTDKDNFTALMWACTEGRIEACTLLLKAGADVTVVDKEGKSAVDLAIENKCFVVADKLMAAGGKPQQSKKLKFKDAFGKKLKRAMRKGELGLEGEGVDEEEVEEGAEGEDEEGVLYGINREAGEEESSESSDEEEEETEEPEETWIAPILASVGTPAHLIYLVEEKLVRQEGFGAAQTLARVPPSLYSRAYLESLGIRGLGLQQVLLDLHTDLHHEFLQQKRHQNQSGGATKAQTHAVTQQHQHQGAEGATTSQSAPKSPKEHKEPKEHRRSKDRSGSGGGSGGGAAQQSPEPQLGSPVKSAKKRTHQDSLQHLEAGGSNTGAGAGGESPTAGTGTASASTTPGSNKRQVVAMHTDG